MQYSVAVNNARLDSVETAIGPSAILKFRTGAAPANCAAADSGTVLATLNLPADWMNPAAAAAKAKAGTWQDLLADATGLVGHYRIYASDGVTCGEQGPVTATGGGGDIEVDDVNFTAGQEVLVTVYSKISGNQ